MCWSIGVSAAMVGLGAVATGVSLLRRDRPAIPATFAYFTLMEGLQAASYPVIDQCGVPANQTLALLSYLHIAFQPFFVNAFAMAILAGVVAAPMRVAAHIVCGVSATSMLLQLFPFDWAGSCTPGSTLCGAVLCVVRGEWHLGWTIPYNGLVPRLELLPGLGVPFPGYVLAVFVMPVLYGAWRFALFHALVGPVLASLLTSNPNEMPAIWCLCSIAIVSVGLSPWLRRRLGGVAWPQLRPALAE